MANDAQQAAKHLAAMASETELKDRMIRQIVGRSDHPDETAIRPVATALLRSAGGGRVVLGAQ